MEEVMMEETPQFRTGERHGWKAVEHYLREYPDAVYDEVEEGVYYAPYHSPLPKYTDMDDELHMIYGMGFDYGVGRALEYKGVRDTSFDDDIMYGRRG